MAGRRFTEQETAKILRKAAELQGQTTSQAPASFASEEEIKAAAKEVGIDPKWIEQAVAVLDTEVERSPRGILGGPAHVEREFVVEGELTVDDWEEIVQIMRKRYKENGTVQTRPGVYEWSGFGGGLRPVLLTLRQVKGAVKASLSVRNDQLGGMIAGLSLIPIFIGFGIASEIGQLAAAFIPLWLTLVFFSARAIYNVNARKSEVEAQDLMKSIRSLVEEEDDSPRAFLPVGEAVREEASQQLRLGE